MNEKPLLQIQAAIASLEERLTEIETVLLATPLEEDEAEFMAERERWLDECRERSAQKRRTS